MKNKRVHDKRLTIAKTMPPMHRTVPGKTYTVKDDRVLDWAKCQTDLVLYLVEMLARIGYIVYDRETGLWRGVDYEA